MQIILNGQPQEIASGLNIETLVKELELEATALVAEYNEQILSREDWAQISLAENDKLELIKFCGGG
ncbi:MAG: sulfur carrier protein ThiS [Candidatus Margulisbacteria bacterium]|jgi:sulfur carrier protein|nr:sulfur carrier protein ThiS [Candidatus Margulisiibacteriota bacterium]